jgi:hypothetical protein
LTISGEVKRAQDDTIRSIDKYKYTENGLTGFNRFDGDLKKVMDIRVTRDGSLIIEEYTPIAWYKKHRPDITSVASVSYPDFWVQEYNLCKIAR